MKQNEKDHLILAIWLILLTAGFLVHIQYSYPPTKPELKSNPSSTVINIDTLEIKEPILLKELQE